MWEHILLHLERNNVIIPLPSTIEGWEDDLKKWPQITYTSIFSYIIDSVAMDGEAMNNLKSSEAYQYLHSNKVGRVLLKEVGHYLVYLKAHTEPSQSLKVQHHQAWVLVSTSGEIQTVGCSSVAAIILWKVKC